MCAARRCRPVPREQARPRLRDRVESAVAPGMAAQHTTHRQIASGTRAVRLERSQCVRRTGRKEAALRADPGAEQEAVRAHRGDQHAARQVKQLANGGLHRTQLAGRAASGRDRHWTSKVSSSWRAALRNAADAALVKTARSNGARKRTTHSPGASRASVASSRATALRTWRLIRLRVTARRAWRLGTTVPSQTRVAEPVAWQSSTAS